MARTVFDRHGRIDVLCNIAGIAPPAPLLETGDENWDKTIDVNLKGVFLCCASKNLAPQSAVWGELFTRPVCGFA